MVLQMTAGHLTKWEVSSSSEEYKGKTDIRMTTKIRRLIVGILERGSSRIL